jgi:hypothetical protein
MWKYEIEYYEWIRESWVGEYGIYKWKYHAQEKG